MVEFKIALDFDQPRTSTTPLEELQATSDRDENGWKMVRGQSTAIEGFPEMPGNRYEFILEQKNDLVNAKESLCKPYKKSKLQPTSNFSILSIRSKKIFKGYSSIIY